MCYFSPRSSLPVGTNYKYSCEDEGERGMRMTKIWLTTLVWSSTVIPVTHLCLHARRLVFWVQMHTHTHTHTHTLCLWQTSLSIFPKLRLTWRWICVRFESFMAFFYSAYVCFKGQFEHCFHCSTVSYSLFFLHIHALIHTDTHTHTHTHTLN